MRRPVFLAGVSALVAGGALAGIARAAASDAHDRLAKLEKGSGGRLGVSLTDPRGVHVIAYRANERFPMCSTFKFLLVALVLARIDDGTLRYDERVRYGKGDLLAYAPVTTKNVGRGYMTVGTLCEAAIALSDNAAANLLLGIVGGPPAVTRFARSLGDHETRLDRTETALNSAIAGDPRDTTSPAAMAGDLRTVLAGEILLRASREKLEDWMIACQTGTACIRAGVPRGWTVGDKTGLGENGTRNDIAFLRPPSSPAAYVTAYLTRATVSPDARNAVLASVGRIAASVVRG
jgi:beta-lactamase class A